MDFNRVVEIVGRFSPVIFMAKLSSVCDITVWQKPRKPLRKGEMTLFISGYYFSLTWKKEILDHQDSEDILLDATLLNEKILKSLLKIEDVKTDERVKYVEGPLGLDGILSRVSKGEKRIGFMLYPVEMEDFIAISDAGKTLPPKSTWFEPRIKNGLIVKEF